ncbi:MAG: tyrosine--tRNA ligase [Culicoidibacterales bacterium]
MIKKSIIYEEILKNAEFICDEIQFKKDMLVGNSKIKLGADPSRPDLHLGHYVILRQLKKMQLLGNEIYFIIGDYTGMIGDPTDKRKTRPQLTYEETRINGLTYFKQIEKVLDVSKTKVVYNSEWLKKLSLEEIIELLSKYTVSQLLQRQDFASRYQQNMPIGMQELIYPLLQGYDSVAIECDIEVGGTDQTFNLLVGRELQKNYDIKQQNVVTFPLLIGLDGKQKMSKSLDNYIALNDEPHMMYQKCMKIPDEILESYFKLTTDVKEEEYVSLINQGMMREAHFLYADTIVSELYDELQKSEAKTKYLNIANKKIPENIDEFTTGNKDLFRLLVDVGFAASTSEARKLITGKGIRIDSKVVESNEIIEFPSEFILQKGKNKFIKIRIKEN